MSAPLLQTATVLVEVVKALGTGGVLAVLLGSTGLGGAITALMAWKKAPVEKRDADMAAAESAQGMSLQLAQELRTELARMGDRISTLETKLDKETTRREALEVEVRDQRDVNYKLRVVLSRVSDAWEYIVTHWSVVRLKEEPPHFPSLTFDD